MSFRKVLMYLGFLGIGVLLFYMAFSMVEDREALWNDMRSASWTGLILSFVMGYLAIVSRGLRWVILLDPLGHKPSSIRTVHAVTFAYFANTFIPRSGELARCAALNQTDDIPVDQLFGTVISERVVDFVILMVLTCIAVFSNLPAFLGLIEGAELPDTTNAVIGGFVLLGALGLAWFKRKMLLQLSFAQKVLSFLKGIWEGLNSIRQMKRKGMFLFHTFFIWSMYFFMAWVIFKSIGAVASITVTQALFIMVAGGFGMVMPAPGGVGAYHWAVMLGFSALGYAQELGFAVANVIWITQTAMIVITGGIAYLALMWFRIRKDRENRPTTTI
jgi:uncharacterized membrane protein YbhN (UPF0104 family)